MGFLYYQWTCPDYDGPVTRFIPRCPHKIKITNFQKQTNFQKHMITYMHSTSCSLSILLKYVLMFSLVIMRIFCTRWGKHNYILKGIHEHNKIWTDAWGKGNVTHNSGPKPKYTVYKMSSCQLLSYPDHTRSHHFYIWHHNFDHVWTFSQNGQLMSFECLDEYGII